MLGGTEGLQMSQKVEFLLAAGRCLQTDLSGEDWHEDCVSHKIGGNVSFLETFILHKHQIQLLTGLRRFL